MNPSTDDSVRELFLNQYGLPLIGDVNSLDLDDLGRENLGLIDSDDMVQRRGRLDCYGSDFMTVDQIPDGEDFLTFAWMHLVTLEEEETNEPTSEHGIEEAVEVLSLLDGLEYTETAEVDDSMECNLNGLSVFNGVQADEVLEMHQLLIAAASHLLVTKYGLDATCVAESEAEIIAVVQTAAQDAVKLGMKPSTIGFYGLIACAGELQHRVEANKPKSVLPPALTREQRSSQSVSTTVEAAAETITRPEGSDWAGRIESAKDLVVLCSCGCKGRILATVAVVPSSWEAKKALNVQNVGSFDLWRVARNPRHRRGLRGNMFSFTQAMEGLLENEAKLKGNNTLMRRLQDVELEEAPSYRYSQFVVEISAFDFKEITRIFAKRGRRNPSDWQALHSALGTASDNRIRLAIAKRIPVWEAREQGLTTVVDLRVLVTLCHDASKRRADQRSWEARQAGHARRRQLNG